MFASAFQKFPNRPQRGVTSIEYALIVALIALAIIGALASTGVETGGLWSDWTTKALAALKR